MAKHKKYIDLWFDHCRKNITLINYREPWKENGNPPMFKIRTNGAKKKNGDACFDFELYIGYLVFNYTNFDLQRKTKNV